MFYVKILRLESFKKLVIRIRTFGDFSGLEFKTCPGFIIVTKNLEDVQVSCIMFVWTLNISSYTGARNWLGSNCTLHLPACIFCGRGGRSKSVCSQASILWFNSTPIHSGKLRDPFIYFRERFFLEKCSKGKKYMQSPTKVEKKE